MNARNALVCLGLLLTYGAQAAPDSRFDGIWVGTETVAQKIVTWDPKEPKRPPYRSAQATIIIAQGGTQIAIIDGFCAGRFQKVWKEGDSINFGAGDCRLKINLSPDGKTL